MTDQDYIKEQWPIGREFSFLGIAYVVVNQNLDPSDRCIGCYYNKLGDLAYQNIDENLLRVIDIVDERILKRMEKRLSPWPTANKNPQS